MVGDDGGLADPMLVGELFASRPSARLFDVGTALRSARLLRLVERYADSLQVGFIAFQRLDGRNVDASGAAFKCFANPAS